MKIPDDVAPRPRKSLVRRVFRFLGLALLGCIIAIAAYAWATGARQLPIETGEPHMKAVIYTDYGSPDVVTVREIKKPEPADNQVLVRVRAASVNPYDWHFLHGKPYIMRLGTGLRKPKVPRLGVDFAGTVEAVGKDVTQFQPGDEVFGGKGGALAQYVCVRESSIARKPANISFEQAGAVQIAGLTALQAIRDKGKVQPGHKVLINGASGGVGTFAVQIAHAFGADTTGVCSTRNVDLVRTLGADLVIDYTRGDFARTGQRYDLILDNVPNHSLSDLRKCLTKNGRYIMIGAGGVDEDPWIGPFGRIIAMSVMSPFSSQKMEMMMADANQKDLQTLADLMSSGQLKPVVEKTYPLDKAADAIRHVESGHARGKVVVTMD